jgi:crossover junction endodeoxyribonuclease RuvC
VSIILGIDPGSRITGYGVIEDCGDQLRYIDSGCIRIAAEDLPERLKTIFSGVSQIVSVHKPDTAAIEQVFMHQNPGAALKLGQARGAAIVAMTSAALSVSEYSARQVKQAVTAYGAADKSQVQEMVCRLLHLNKTPQADAADALAVAICHAHSAKSISGIEGVKGIAQGRLR